MDVWIDLSNSPHPLLFAPIARELERRGHSVSMTARDNAQTVELARGIWPEVEVVGEESPAGRVGKAASLAGRVIELRRWARRRRPDVALSHNSYAQVAAARAARVPAVTAMDYEHQPANHLAFRLAQAILVPEAFPAELARRQGAGDRLVSYPGLKESLYLGDFVPDPDVLDRLGLDRGGESAIVTARTPPSRAIYHQVDNPLFGQLITALSEQPEVRTVVLPRHEEQRRELERMALPGVTISGSALDSRSLMYVSDLVIGAGGTMTREAALMGIPTVSVFAGEVPAVDRQLESRGVLRRLGSVAELGRVEPRAAEPLSVEELRSRGEALRDLFVETTLRVGAS